MAKYAASISSMTMAMTISGTIGWFVLMSGRPVWDIVFWRCAFAILGLSGYCYFTKSFQYRLSRKETTYAIIGGVAIALNWLLIFESYKYASVSISTAIYNIQPFILLGFGAFLFNERITPLKIMWLCVAFLGLILIVLEKPSAEYVGSNFSYGVLLAVGAALGWAIAAATTKKIATVPPQLVALIHVGIGFLILLPFAELKDLPSTSQTWLIYATLGLVHTGLTYVLLYSAVQRLPTHLQGTLTFINPIVAVHTDIFALGHDLKSIQIAGIAIILIAACGTTLRS